MSATEGTTYGVIVAGSTAGHTHGFIGNFKYNFDDPSASVELYTNAGEGIQMEGAAGLRFYATPDATVGATFQPTERMTILSESGNVGIGQTAPIALLHCGTNTGQTVMPGTQQAIISANSVTSTTNWQLAIEGDNDSGILFTEDNAKRGLVGYDAGNSQVMLGDNDGDNSWRVATGSDSIYGYAGGSAVIELGAPGGWGTLNLEGTAGAEIQLFDSGVDYGGLYASETHGVVLQTSNNGADNIFFRTNGGVTMTCDENNRVGIGETDPEKKIHVKGAGSVIGLMETTSNNACYLMFQDNTSSDNQQVRIGSVGNAMALWAGDNERMRINSDGDIGIPTGSRLYFDDLDGGGDTFIVQDTGNKLDLYTSGVIAITMDGNQDVDVPNGVFTAQTKTFKIDHPLPEKKDTHHLTYSCIEGPKADLIWRGTADLSAGYAQVDLDAAAGQSEGTFEALARDSQCWIQNDTGWSAVRGDVEGNTLTIECEATDSDDTVSWMVVAERCDPAYLASTIVDDEGRFIVEPEKPEEG